MSYIYKVFKHLKQLWMGIWQHIHTVTTTDVSPDLGEFAEILDDVVGVYIVMVCPWTDHILARNCLLKLKQIFLEISNETISPLDFHS
jgi:phage-related holin